MDKSLVIGASGLVGGALLRHLQQRDTDVIGTCTKGDGDLVALDLSEWWSIRSTLDKIQPKVVYVPGAIAHVDRCESDPYAHRVNVDGIYTLVHWCSNRVKVVFFSSSYVFDGKNEERYSVWDTPFPAQVYGIQKWTSEAIVLKYTENLVIRTSSVFGAESKKKNFGYQVVESLRKGEEYKAIDDQWVNPIWAGDLAQIAVGAVDFGLCGLAHAGGTEDVTKAEFAMDIADQFGLDKSKIVPVTGHQIGQVAKRPYNGCLKYSVKPQHDYLGSIKKFYDEY